MADSLLVSLMCGRWPASRVKIGKDRSSGYRFAVLELTAGRIQRIDDHSVSRASVFNCGLPFSVAVDLSTGTLRPSVPENYSGWAIDSGFRDRQESDDSADTVAAFCCATRCCWSHRLRISQGSGFEAGLDSFTVDWADPELSLVLAATLPVGGWIAAGTVWVVSAMTSDLLGKGCFERTMSIGYIRTRTRG
ncbi:hypothetical protein [Rubripirellula lacrimiformis]|uniref:hypothetical protein n=1 Tax=Rubripirellula lacrimiformis TaxID=1930273 RepID=UPI00119DC503|nr:hypothetical protein [Rubripirellula lacrimiformis]